MEMKTHHWLFLAVVAVFAYYAGSMGWLKMITSKVGGAA